MWNAVDQHGVIGTTKEVRSVKRDLNSRSDINNVYLPARWAKTKYAGLNGHDFACRALHVRSKMLKVPCYVSNMPENLITSRNGIFQRKTRT